jgi:hypothetical protein
LCGRSIFERKACAKIGAAGASAHYVAFGTTAEAQAESINGNRFTGTGFPGDGGHATVKIATRLTVDLHIANRLR